MKTLGILGGMSAESSILYYQQINQAVHQRLGGNHGAKLLIANLDFEDVVVLQKNGQWQQAGELLADHAKRLQNAGADGILLATNTMHKVAPIIESQLDVPFLHLLTATVEVIQQKNLKKIGLLGTLFTMTDGFYQAFMADKGIEIIVPNPTQREAVHRIIYDELCCGNITTDSKATYLQIINQLQADGAEAVILGCTEIGLLIQQADTALPILDTSLIHIDYAVEWMLRP